MGWLCVCAGVLCEGAIVLSYAGILLASVLDGERRKTLGIDMKRRVRTNEGRDCDEPETEIINEEAVSVTNNTLEYT